MRPKQDQSDLFPRIVCIEVDKKKSFLVKELETGCWQTSSPKGERISLEGEKNASTIQRCAQSLELREQDHNLQSLTLIVSGFSLTLVIDPLFLQIILVGFPSTVPEILD